MLIEIIHKSIVNFVTHHAHVIFYPKTHTRARACMFTNLCVDFNQNNAFNYAYVSHV